MWGGKKFSCDTVTTVDIRCGTSTKPAARVAAAGSDADEAPKLWTAAGSFQISIPGESFSSVSPNLRKTFFLICGNLLVSDETREPPPPPADASEEDNRGFIKQSEAVVAAK